MLGPPGAGKSTQAERLARERGLPRIATGEVLREAIRTSTPLGRHVEAIVPQEELVRRLSTRRICSRCGANADAFDGDAARCRRCGGELVQRADDSAETVRERLKVYEQETKPLLEYYSSRPTFQVVNGAQPPERVAEEVAKKCDSAIAAAGLR